MVRLLAREGTSFNDIVGLMRLTPETVRECLDQVGPLPGHVVLEIRRQLAAGRSPDEVAAIAKVEPEAVKACAAMSEAEVPTERSIAATSKAVNTTPLATGHRAGGRARRYREVPVTHPRQRALLDEVRALVGDGSLIPLGKNYVQAQKPSGSATGPPPGGVARARPRPPRRGGNLSRPPLAGTAGGVVMNKRTATVPPLLDRVRDMAANAREVQAEAAFALEAVHDAIRAAAGEGANTVTIPPGKPVDLRETKAAKATRAALAAEGFRVEWEPVAGKPGEAPTHVLKVGW